MLAESFDDVTILFADIVGFTKYSAGKEPRQVIEMLSKLFTEFDKECNRLNLYKVYTIGDCYVVLGFIDKRNRKPPSEEASDVIQMGISMIQSINKVRKQVNFMELNMRIGIHTVILATNDRESYSVGLSEQTSCDLTSTVQMCSSQIKWKVVECLARSASARRPRI